MVRAARVDATRHPQTGRDGRRLRCESVGAPLHGRAATLADYAPVRLIVNVASRCGLAPQYAKLEELQRCYAHRGFTVRGFLSNQFLQELGDTEKISEYCSTTWPMLDKVRAAAARAASADDLQR